MAVLLDNPDMLTINGRKSARLPSLKKGDWYVACVKSNQDRAFATEMIARKVSTFIPLMPTTARSGRYTHDTQKPVFPGYVFFHGSIDCRMAALETKRTFSIIMPYEIYQERLQKQLQQVYCILTLTPTELAVQQGKIPGKQCLITEGRLKGTTGTIKCLEKGEVVITVDVLGQGILVKTQPEHLEVLS